MKKIFVSLCTAACVLLASQSVMASKTLRLTLQLPAGHHLGKNVQSFADIVEEKSNGDLKVEIYPSAQLYKDKEVPQAVASGAVEMGVVPLTRFAGTIPAVEIFYVPFLFSSEEAIKKATAKDSVIRGPLDAEILKTGARVLWWQAYGGAVLLSKEEAIKMPADLKGKKVRVFSKTLGALVEAAGGMPTTISGSEQFLAYQRGTVDVGMTGVTATQKRKLYQVMNNLTATRSMVDVEFIVLINDKTWLGMSASEQAIVSEAAATVEKDLRDKMAQLEADAFTFVSKKIDIVDLTATELTEWKKLAAPVVDTYVENSGALGKQLVESAKSLK